jgi:hypothetical protein
VSNPPKRLKEEENEEDNVDGPCIFVILGGPLADIFLSSRLCKENKV